MRKWVDYSSKYGLGFCLSDQTEGTYFNDSVKIVSDEGSKSFSVIPKSGPTL